PPAMVSSASPTATSRLALSTASIPEPHKRLVVAPGTDVGSPASRAAMRATLRFSSPAPLPLPRCTSSIVAGSRPGWRSTSEAITPAARSSGRTPASAPPIFPIGVRTASMMKASTAGSYVSRKVSDTLRDRARQMTFVRGDGVMMEPDAAFADPRLARLYDVFDDDRDDLEVYAALAVELGARA